MDIKIEDKSQAAIIFVNEVNDDPRVIAFVKTALKNGQDCAFSYTCCEEWINANRDVNLVSARNGKISRAKKYLQPDDNYSWHVGSANEVNEGEFLLSSSGQWDGRDDQ